jgi:tetratricopeptide (TPR) repeat protein
MKWPIISGKLFSRSVQEPVPLVDSGLASDECSVGMAKFQRGDAAGAAEHFARALKSDPNHFDALQLSGIAAYQLGQLKLARSFLTRAVLLKPQDASLQSNLGLVLGASGSSQEAIKAFDKAIEVAPNFLPAHLNKSLIRQKLGQLEETLAELRLGRKSLPQSAELTFEIARVYERMGRSNEAQRAYLETLHLNPESVDARVNLGRNLMDSGDFSGALAQFEEAIARAEQSFPAHLNRSSALFKLGRFRESIESAKIASQLEPRSALPFLNMGAAFDSIADVHGALEAYDVVLAIDPGNAATHVNRGLLLLLLGRLAEGWPEVDWRWKDDAWTKGKPKFSQPRWDGALSLKGKTILVHHDQGLGDIIQFSRFVPKLLELGASVLLEVPESLMELMIKSYTEAHCFRFGRSRPSFDVQISFTDLPLVFATTLDTIPAPMQVVVSDDLSQTWMRRLGKKTAMRIGLVWKGNPNHKNDMNRSIGLESVMSVIPPDAQVISLQVGLDESERSFISAHAQMSQFEAEITDFAQTAALCSTLDLVITVDTSVAHLSGSMGLPTLLLVPFMPDWRWLLDRNDSPWYSSITLFRQAELGDWGATLAALKTSLSDQAFRN